MTLEQPLKMPAGIREPASQETRTYSPPEAQLVTPADLPALLKEAKTRQGYVVFNLGADGRSPFTTSSSDTVFNIDPTERSGPVRPGQGTPQGTYYALEAYTEEVTPHIPPDLKPDVITIIAPNPNDLLDKDNTLLQDARTLARADTRLIIVLETESNELNSLAASRRDVADEDDALELIERHIRRVFPRLEECDTLTDALDGLGRQARGVNSRMSYAEDTEGQYLILANTATPRLSPPHQ